MKDKSWRINYRTASLVVHSVTLKNLIRKVSRSLADVSIDSSPFRFF